MGWTLEIYDKAAACESPSNLANCMFELHRAILERRDLAGFTGDIYLSRGDGTNGNISSAEDFKDLPIGNWNPYTLSDQKPGLLFGNLTATRDRILALIDSGKFMKASGQSEALDRAWVSAQIGTDIEADPLAPLHAAYWQGLQDALDLLIYLKVPVNFVLDEEHCPDAQASRFLSGAQDSLEEAWDVMAGASADVDSYWDVPGIVQRTQWFVFYNSADYFASRQYFTDFAITLPAQEGTLTHACYRGAYYARYCSLDEVEVQIGDAAGTLDLTVFPSPITPAQTFYSEHFDPGVSATDPVVVTFSTAITTDLPDDCPLAPLAGVGNEGQVYFSVSGIDLYFDLSAELEDQA